MHIASGIAWLQGRQEGAQVDNPPLPRILSALPAWVRHLPIAPTGELLTRGNSVLYQGNYRRNISEARYPTLIFFLLALAAVALWGRRHFGATVGITAMVFFAETPAIRAHAGLATTDLAVTAMFIAAVLLLEYWIEAPSGLRGCALGIAVGAGAISKFSFLSFFAVSAAIVLLTHAAQARRLRLPAILVVIAVTVAVVWAGYRFETGTLDQASPATNYLIHEVVPTAFRAPTEWASSHIVIPAPLFVVGVMAVQADNLHGYKAFLLGETRRHGWWYYFPVALVFKTPIPLLLLSGIGLATIVASPPKTRSIALIAGALLALVCTAGIDLGIRHVLVIYGPLSVAAAVGARTLWRKRMGRVPAALLVFWMILGTERAHPDYLAWFNEAAGSHPEQILVDSNLDWGQDYLRLLSALRARHVRRIFLLPFGSVELWKDGIDAPMITPTRRDPGWYVMSETGLALDPDAEKGAYRWLEAYPYTRVGKSLRLYRVPRSPAANTSARS